jgi:hypothetical protein
MNNDYEEGIECNLGYKVEYVLTDVDSDTWEHISSNCQLFGISYVKEGKIDFFTPNKFEGKVFVPKGII